MINFLFTLDYEIYGNGTGSLRELVYDPTERLRDMLRKWNAKGVMFVEVAEFERIEEAGSDPAIGLVKRQVREMYKEGHEIALHLHPQWYNARYENGAWQLDYSEYNLCTLAPKRISEIVQRAVEYLRHMVDDPLFVPLSFRAGNWLFQPTANAAAALAEHGIRVDSSVFKGGVQHNHNLDYRPANRNGYYWPFSNEAARADKSGRMIEVPIYSELVPSWRMATGKRIGYSNSFGGASGQSTMKKLNRLRDFLRFRYPLKLDFCRMTLPELTSMLDRVVEADKREPNIYRPLVAIGHSKDLHDLETLDALLAYLDQKQIGVGTFESIHSMIAPGKLVNRRHRVAEPAGTQ